MADFPRTLTPVDGPHPPGAVQNGADGMGKYGAAVRELVADGFIQPDLLTNMTLLLLAGQPRKPRTDGTKKPGATAGRVWVREQYTIHQPVAHAEVWRAEGEITGTYVRKGRSYSTTACRSFSSDGGPLATNLTTGLLSYRPDPELEDSVQGLALQDTPSPKPDWTAAASNPHLERLRRSQVGDVFGGERVLMTFEMMAARAGDAPDNPIHSDREKAKQAGLARPIAGGNHVLSFGLEAIMQGLGPQSLLHGAHLDVRWKAPTEDGVHIVPKATVTVVEPDRVVLDIHVGIDQGPTAMVATVTIPITP